MYHVTSSDYLHSKDRNDLFNDALNTFYFVPLIQSLPVLFPSLQFNSPEWTCVVRGTFAMTTGWWWSPASFSGTVGDSARYALTSVTPGSSWSELSPFAVPERHLGHPGERGNHIEFGLPTLMVQWLSTRFTSRYRLKASMSFFKSHRVWITNLDGAVVKY